MNVLFYYTKNNIAFEFLLIDPKIKKITLYLLTNFKNLDNQ